MERDELAAWLRLTLTPGVGNDSARRLLAAFGLPQAVFGQPASALQQVVSLAQAGALRSEPPTLAAQLDATWQWLHGPADPEAAQPGRRRVLVLGDTDYPAALLSLEDPPLMLYLLGSADFESNPPEVQAGGSFSATETIASSLSRSIAIVGSRNPTPQGAANARQFARALSAAGLTVVSGLALGVDGAAHEGALEGAAPDAGLATIAVVGTGLDRVYPKQHLELARRIARRGLLISEYPLGTPPLAANFPRRNRLIAGLSRGTLVVEAALQSGSLITARLAVEQGKDVFAIPGSIHATQSRGCHALIKQGAKLVESAQDVLEELRLPAAPDSIAPKDQGTRTSASKEPESTLLQRLGHDPVSLDALMARTGLPAPELQARLLELELEGQVARLPGGLFQRLGAG
ncbi:DNA-processing protein DprA [Variovorax terrae]|uniref:DNA-processing protein DprA n=1 Tax=Variovorax terrae TaxID=2923278 RepID=A0A9X2ASZ0_9BURK|nr:DNA-processing protein DprA [Variovorax terrae]MCJ0765846.1 DNA-processing protein DprA [Variovorax terrae]